MTINLENIDLPKWPALLVVGQSITREQAEHVLLRTEQWYGSNARDWDAYWFHELTARGFLVDMNQGYHFFRCSAHENVERGCIPLEYLRNSRVSSCWIGGAHGWCDWNGRIFSNNYNIGKWPSAKEVLEEWETIARAFPFLDLKAQLLSGEIGEEDTVPLIEYHVKDGKVLACEPTEVLAACDFSINFSTRSEQGCSKEVLDRALDNVFGPRIEPSVLA